MHPPHLQRLQKVWIDHPVYFITTCTQGRRPILASLPMVEILQDEWRSSQKRHGWHIGRFVVMPDHVHFFAVADSAAKPMEQFMAKWKEWTAKRITSALQIEPPLWQPRFFDHLLRSSESYAEKWSYVLENPVRARLVPSAAEWPFQGHVHFD